MSEHVDHTTVVEWVKELHATTAKLDARLWLDSMTTGDMSVKFYGGSDIRGRAQVEPVFVGFFSRLDAMEHDMQVTDFVSPRVYHQCRVHYLPKGGDRVRDMVSMDIQCIYHVRTEHEKLRCFRMEIYGDPSELNKKLGSSG